MYAHEKKALKQIAGKLRERFSEEGVSLWP